MTLSWGELFPTAAGCQQRLLAAKFSKCTCLSLSFSDQLEPLGGKTDILDLSANLALACPTQVTTEGWPCPSLKPELRLALA